MGLNEDLVVNALHGDLEKVMELVSQGAEVNPLLHWSWNTPLESALIGGHHKITAFLLKHGANPNGCSPNSRTPLFLAAARGDLKSVEMLVEHGADIHLRIGIETPIDCAYRHRTDNNQDTRFEEVARYLESKGAHRAPGRGALHEAAQRGDLNTVTHWVEAGADVNLKDDSKTPICLAAEAGHREVVDYLVAHGAHPVGVLCAYMDLNDLAAAEKFLAKREAPHGDCSLFTWYKGYLCEPIHYALEKQLPVEFIRTMLQHGEDPNAISAGADTYYPVHDVLTGEYPLENKKELLKILVEAGADLNTFCYHGTPLHIAAEEGDTQMVEFLLDLGADPEPADNNDDPYAGWHGPTPYQTAFESGQTEVLSVFKEKLQLGKKADDDIQRVKWRKAFYTAAEAGDVATLEQVLSQAELHTPGITTDWGYNALFRQIRNGNITTVAWLLDKKWDPMFIPPGCYRENAAQCAISCFDLRIFTLLLENAGSLITPNGSESLLHRSALVGNAAATALLLERGVPLESLDCLDQTPLHDAAKPGNESDVQTLEKHRHETGWLEAHQEDHGIRQQLGREKNVQLLLEHGANPNLVDKYGKTPLDYALEKGSRVVIDLLQKHGAKTKKELK